MTKRQAIKARLTATAIRGGYTHYEQFKKAAIAEMDCLDDGLQDELDRIESKPKGITRLISESWNEARRA